MSSKPLSGNQRISTDLTSPSGMSASGVLYNESQCACSPARLWPWKWFQNCWEKIASCSVAFLSALYYALAFSQLEFTQRLAHSLLKYSINYNASFSTIHNNQVLFFFFYYNVLRKVSMVLKQKISLDLISFSPEKHFFHFKSFLAASL